MKYDPQLFCVNSTQNLDAGKSWLTFAYKLRKMKTTAVIIARFQTPYLHPGHHQLIESIAARHRKTVVALGMNPVKGSRRNPYDFYTRERMLKAAYPSLFVLPLADHPSDEVWSGNLDALLQSSFPAESFVLYGSRDSFIPAYSGALPVEELPGREGHSATALRTEYADAVLDSQDFRMGINYAYHNTYATVHTTVDIALFKEERSCLLLGKKKGRDGWRLPGGFADVTDAGFEAAAHRELTEECGPLEVGAMQYVGSMQVDDWRYRREVNKVMTLLFATDLLYGSPKAADDLEKVEWFAVSGLEAMIADGQIVSEHQPLVKMLMQKNFVHTISNRLLIEGKSPHMADGL